MQSHYETQRFRQTKPQAEHDTLIGKFSVKSETLSEVPSDVIIKSRITYGSRWSACKGLLMEYSKSTTIHGVRYLFEVHRPIYEKILWLFWMAFSFYFAISLIWDTYLKWQDSPVILGFDETLVPVHKIPFPTITICPEIKLDQNVFSFNNVSKKMWQEIRETGTFDNFNGTLSQDELAHLIASLQICDSEVVERFAKYLPADINPDVAQTLVDLSISKNETAPFCKWNSRFYFCDKIFNFVATDDGICYQFNGLQNKDLYRDERFMSYTDEQVVDFNNFFDDLPLYNNLTGNWSLDSGYMAQGYNSYPQRSISASSRHGFYALLQGFDHNFDYACRSFKQGYKVFLNSPESVPLTTGNYVLVPYGDEVIVSVLPQYVMSTKDLHDFEPAKRQCYFNDERYLRFFRFYSQSNCQTECLTNYTISKCGCAKFWMPKPIDTPTCKLIDMDCLYSAEDELNRLLQIQTIQKLTDPKTEILCDCMPSCNSLNYDFEISRARYNFQATITAFREEYEHKDFLASRLGVYFREHQFTAVKRTVLFSITTLIANWGGIFGLFMGISSFSIIELLYFFSLRLFSNIRKRRIKKRKLLKDGSGHDN